MQIQNAATNVAQFPETTSSEQKPKAGSNIEGLANQNTFLQLLIAQIKNQDPLQPTDSVQFLSQLAQFSQLEQLIGIRQELQASGAKDENGKTPDATETTN